MKNLIYITLISLGFLLVACEDELLPKANLNLMEVATLTATPGDMEVNITWTPMENAKPTGYFLTWTPGTASLAGGEIILEADKTNHLVGNLINGETYTFFIQAIYGDEGRSGKISTRSRPLSSRPAPTSFTAIPNNASVELKWTKPTNTNLTGYSLVVSPGSQTFTVSKDVESFIVTGLTNGVLYSFEMSAVYPNGLSDKATSTATPADVPVGYLWSSIELRSGDLSGYVKTSNPVFSPDGNTIYIPTSTPNGHLFAVDRVTGIIKWVFQIPTITYGGGAVVGNDGTIYQCGTDSKVYAINPNGTQKWVFTAAGAFGAFPALSADGFLYCLANGTSSTLYAINVTSGNKEWEQSLSGNTGGAVAIDNAGNIYAGTNSKIFKYNSKGEKQWETGALILTERGSFAIDGTTLYAALRGGAGIAAVNMVNGDIKWTFANASASDAYFPIVGKDGTIYFNEKNASGKVYAVNPNGTEKWNTVIGVTMNYLGLVLSDAGKLYGGTNARIGTNYQVFEIDAATGAKSVILETDQQLMAAATIGPDNRLYLGSIRALATDNFGKLFAIPINAGLEKDSWSMRGKNIQGTSR
ncbi:MAG: PQQ-binding-like beta-propeller repeat protein [Paludibacter sp.]|nr:PQQ-binding-like beta-propeller repeat protein [Paludibacter sp.]